MQKLKIAFAVLITLVVVLAATFFLVGYLKPKPGGVRINTNPSSQVYINGVYAGKTPYKGTNTPGQINLKLIPDDDSQKLITYETKINLVSGIETVVVREFGPTEEASAGEVISFEKTGGKLAGLVVISSPDNAQVWIDGTSQGFTPYNFNSITTGPHKIMLKMAGHGERTLNIKTRAGLKLTAYIKLAESNGNDLSATPTPTPQSGPKKYVVIGNTSTGFLRMRTEPGTNGEEIAELKPGQKYLWLDTDQETGWYKIQYIDPAPGLPNGVIGWISNQYSKIIEDSSTSSPAPSPIESN